MSGTSNALNALVCSEQIGLRFKQTSETVCTDGRVLGSRIKSGTEFQTVGSATKKALYYNSMSPTAVNVEPVAIYCKLTAGGTLMPPCQHWRLDTTVVRQVQTFGHNFATSLKF